MTKLNENDIYYFARLSGLNARQNYNVNGRAKWWFESPLNCDMAIHDDLMTTKEAYYFILGYRIGKAKHNDKMPEQ